MLLYSDCECSNVHKFTARFILYRLSSEWTTLVYYVDPLGGLSIDYPSPHTHTHMHTDLMANISMNQYRFPSKEDFSGATAAIRRLQDTYQLQPTVIASGKLGSSSALPMSGESAHTTTSKACWNIERDTPAPFLSGTLTCQVMIMGLCWMSMIKPIPSHQ